MRKIPTSLAVSVGAATLAIGLAAPASATSVAPQANWACSAASFCVYAESGGRSFLASLGPAGGFFNMGLAGLGDKVISARNTGSSVGVLWDFSSSAGCWDLMLTIKPGAEINLPTVDQKRTDAISHLGFNPPAVCNV